MKKKLLLFVLFVGALSVHAIEQQALASTAPLVVAKTSQDTAEAFNPSEMIMHHILDGYTWHIFDGHYGVVYLPIILYSTDRGLEIFSSRNFYNEAHERAPHKGYRCEESRIVPIDKARTIIDISVTKNVLFLFLNALLLFVVFVWVASAYKKRPQQTPKGLQSFVEPVIVFVSQEIVKPSMGKHYQRFVPYMLTLFFFVLFGNLMGLFPAAANLTGNIAVTMVLAIFTFLLTNFKGKGQYWGHVFNPPGVPILIKPLIVLVEFIGLFTKPISLMVRLFVAITAGHIVLLSLLSLAFIFQSYAVGLVSSLMLVFINLIELMVSLIQAYVFTMFSSLYIGMAMEESH